MMVVVWCWVIYIICCVQVKFVYSMIHLWGYWNLFIHLVSINCCLLYYLVYLHVTRRFARLACHPWLMRSFPCTSNWQNVVKFVFPIRSNPIVTLQFDSCQICCHREWVLVVARVLVFCIWYEWIPGSVVKIGKLQKRMPHWLLE